MKQKVVIAGSGFRGFCDALHLLHRQDLELTIIDSAPFFGGIMHSMNIKGFAVDKGVHIFSSIPTPLIEVINDVMDGHVHEITTPLASAFNGKVTKGFALPDLHSLEDQRIQDQIQSELLQLATVQQHKKPETLREHFQQRYGETAGYIFSEIFQKVYGLTTEEVEPEAIAQTSMGRLKFLDDTEMLKLKENPWLDSVLAARRQHRGIHNALVSLYPSDGKAMGGWCNRAQAWLEKHGVTVRLGRTISTLVENEKKLSIKLDNAEVIEADYLIWSNAQMNALSGALGLNSDVDRLQYGTPMLFVTLFTRAENIGDFSYLQNFDPNELTYRSAAAGIYSCQIQDGISFITCECPTKIGSTNWNNPNDITQDVWQEIKDLGVVSASAQLIDFDVKRIPQTFKLAKRGYNDILNNFFTDIENRYHRIVLRDVTPFFRSDIYNDTKHLSKIT